MEIIEFFRDLGIDTSKELELREKEHISRPDREKGEVDYGCKSYKGC